MVGALALAGAVQDLHAIRKYLEIFGKAKRVLR